ncbi:MAG: DUF58 domain-containing protein [Waddliaceae bacterium]
MAAIPRKVFEKIRHIQIRTAQFAEDIFAGAWHSAFKGQGMEFEEVREYQSGDDIRTIDWNVTARMSHPYIKVFREERELTVMLVVDVSASSRFGSHRQLKRDLIAEIGAVLAFSAIKNHDKVGLILFSQKVEKYIPPKKGIRHVLRVIRELLVFEPKHAGTDLADALSFLGGIQRKSCICFLISDFLCPEHAHECSLIANKHDLVSIAVSDPYELEFPNMEIVNVKDLETGEFSVVDSSDQRVHAQFQKKAQERLGKVEQLMKRIGAGFIFIRTDRPYLDPLRKFFKMKEIKR